MQSMETDLNNVSVLVTGGTGSFGYKFVEMVLLKFPKVKRLVVFSRDELKQFEMAQKFSVSVYPALRFFIGDVRDKDRLKRACEDIDIIIHAAAMKHVPIAEYNPMECIKTNVLGAQNVVEVALDTPTVRKVIALSTDKAAAPINLYGATKLCSDKLFIAANAMKGARLLTFSVVRYGNVLGSRGSVFPFFLQQRFSPKLPITHPDMTRFSISLEEGVCLVFRAISHSQGGETFIAKIPSYRIVDVAKAINRQVEFDMIGIRPGEKLHEEMITVADSFRTVEFNDHFVICAESMGKTVEEYCKMTGATRVCRDFSYRSDKNAFLSIEEIQAAIKEHIDPTFERL